MATNTRRTASPRYNSSLSAAREGWHKWASKHWGWFTPVLFVIGVGRGSWKAARWVGPKVMRHSNRVGRWLDGAAADLLSRHPRTRRFASWFRTSRKPTGATNGGMQCSYCGAQLTATNAAAHIAAHNRQAQTTTRPVAAPRRPAPATGSASNVVPMRRPSPQPRPNAQPSDGVVHDDCFYCLGCPKCRPNAGTFGFECGNCGVRQAGFRTEAESRAAGAKHVCSQPAPAAKPTSPATAGPAAAPTTTGGNSMSNATPETQQLARASAGIGDMDPATAWELDAQLQGLSRAMFTLSEGLGQWIETLDAIKTDPRVTAQAGVAVGEIAETVRTFAVTRQLFRNLYAAQFAAAEANVRQVQRQNFFNPNAA